MKFEWDETKRQATLNELQLDFADLEQAAWDIALTRRDWRHKDGARYRVLVPFRRGLLHVVLVYRHPATRNISMRWASGTERKEFIDGKYLDR